MHSVLIYIQLSLSGPGVYQSHTQITDLSYFPDIKATALDAARLVEMAGCEAQKENHFDVQT